MKEKTVARLAFRLTAADLEAVKSIVQAIRKSNLGAYATKTAAVRYAIAATAASIANSLLVR